VVSQAQKDVEDRIADGIRQERDKIAADETRKARMLVSDELTGKTKEIGALQQILKAKDDRLAEAQKAQAELVRNQRELDDAKRELDLTVETRVRQQFVLRTDSGGNLGANLRNCDSATFATPLFDGFRRYQNTVKAFGQFVALQNNGGVGPGDDSAPRSSRAS
jgi:hypothetical protein